MVFVVLLYHYMLLSSMFFWVRHYDLYTLRFSRIGPVIGKNMPHMISYECQSLYAQFTLCPTLAISLVIVATALGCLKAR